MELSSIAAINGRAPTNKGTAASRRVYAASAPTQYFLRIVSLIHMMT